MYTLTDAKLDASDQVKNLNSNFMYNINSNNSELLVSEDFIDIIKTARVLCYAESALKHKLLLFQEAKAEYKDEVIYTYIDLNRFTFNIIIIFQYSS